MLIDGQQLHSEMVKHLPKDVGPEQQAGSTISSRIEREPSHFRAWYSKEASLGGRMRARTTSNGWRTIMRTSGRSPGNRARRNSSQASADGVLRFDCDTDDFLYFLEILPGSLFIALLCVLCLQRSPNRSKHGLKMKLN